MFAISVSLKVTIAHVNVVPQWDLLNSLIYNLLLIVVMIWYKFSAVFMVDLNKFMSWCLNQFSRDLITNLDAYSPFLEPPTPSATASNFILLLN